MDAPNAIAVLLRDDRRVVLGPIDDGQRCGLGLIDELLRLQLALLRLGWQLRLEAVQPELRELFELVGLTDHLEST